MLTKIKKLLIISRPFSWVNTAYPFGAGYLATGGSLDATFFIGTFYFLIPYNLLMYGINDVFDYESDMRNPRKGGIEGAREQKVFHPTIVAAAILANLPFAVWALAKGPVGASLAFTVLIFLVAAYSMKGLRFKEVPILDSITSSAHFVGPLVYALMLTGFQTDYLPFVIAFFMWGMASHAFGAVQDINPDREGKIASIATALGARNTMQLVFSFYVLSAALLISQGTASAIIGIACLAYAANAWPYLWLSDQDSAQANKGWRRFLWLNLSVGFLITILLILHTLPTDN